MPRMTGAEAIVKSIIPRGVDTVFALPGVQLDPLFNAFFDAGPALRVIHTRHEQGAGYMAWGYAAATGGVGTYAVVPGPGFLNASAALSTAYATNAKVLCVTGQIPSDFIGRGVGLLHEIPDQLAVLRGLTKWAQRIDSPPEAPPAIAEAFRQLHSGRPRPVAVEMAMDVMAREEEVELLPEESRFGRPAVDPDAILEAAKLLGQAEAPMIFAGSGAMDAIQEIAALAEALEAPVIAGLGGRGVLSSRHHLSHTMPAGHRLWAKADVVLAVGTRLAFPQIHWGTDAALKIVRIDIDPDEHDRVAPPAVRIAADSKDALAALIPKLEGHNRRRASRKDELNGLKATMDREYARLEPQLSYLAAIREELPDDGIFVDGLTQVGYVSRFALPVYRPRTYVSSGYQGTLGASFACALGVKVACPDKPVISVSGDGGFMFNVQELATAVQQEIGLVALVFNDGAYGNILRYQKEKYGNRIVGSELCNPDFVKLAESFGAQGLRADSPEELRPAIRKGFETKGPTLIEVPVGAMPEPWSFVMMPRIRGSVGGPLPI